MNLCVGDYIEFALPQFEGGSFYTFGGRRVRGSKGSFTGDKSFSGTIEKDWYDVNSRHWFSVRLDTGKIKRVQGKNLYGKVSLHRPGENHNLAATEKRERKQTGIWV
jgi:hypothetical protein